MHKDNTDRPYSYVSFSELGFRYDVDRLIDAARDWEVMDSEVDAEFSRLALSADLIRASVNVSGETTNTVDAILNVLLLDEFRCGPATNVLDHKEYFQEKIAAAISASRPVELIIPSFPGREVNPIARTRPQIHLGELASLCKLASLCASVRKVYSPGLVITIVTDGVAYAPFYGDCVAGAVGYKTEFERAIRDLGIDDVIRVADLATVIDERKAEYDRVYAAVETEIKAVWRDPSYKFRDELIHTMKLGTQSGALNAALAHIVKFTSAGEIDSERLRRAREAITAASERTAFVYHCLLVTMRRMEILDRKFPDAIRGTVHPKPKQYSPFLVNPHTTVSPWHGVAVLRKDRRIDVLYEAEVLQDHTNFVATYLPGEVVPFYYRAK
jgi:pyoverdine/dityrosine biosynthesis protein Dit1